TPLARTPEDSAGGWLPGRLRSRELGTAAIGGSRRRGRSTPPPNRRAGCEPAHSRHRGGRPYAAEAPSPRLENTHSAIGFRPPGRPPSRAPPATPPGPAPRMRRLARWGPAGRDGLPARG